MVQELGEKSGLRKAYTSRCVELGCLAYRGGRDPINSITISTDDVAPKTSSPAGNAAGVRSVRNELVLEL